MERGHHHIRTLVNVGRTVLELAGEATPIIDEQFMAGAARVAEQGGFFTVIDQANLIGEKRPDAIKHDMALLPPNPYSNKEIDDTLWLIDVMLGSDQAAEVLSIFSKEASKLRLFERIKSTPEKPGEKLLVVSNHLNLPDQGFTMGFLHKAAAKEEVDRLEHHLTVVVGRLIGYFNLDKSNVVDDVLRKVGSVLKTFPNGGSESLTEDQQQVLSVFRRVCNHYTKQAFGNLIDSRTGQIICMAPSGEEDKFDPNAGMIRMRKFSEGTNELMIEACKKGARIVPAFVDYGSDASIVEFLPECSVNSQEDCHEIGRAIAAMGSYAHAEAKQQHQQVERFNYPIAYGA